MDFQTAQPILNSKKQSYGEWNQGSVRRTRDPPTRRQATRYEATRADTD